MINYTCYICKKIFNQKIDYKRHINRKNSCESQINLESQKNHLESQKNHLESQNNHLECSYCSKKFNTNSNYNRHIKHFCKAKKEGDIMKETIYQELVDKMNKLEKRNEELEEKLNEINLKNNKTGNTKNSNNKNSNNIINNTQNNINLVAFGKEDMSYITEKLYKKLLANGLGSVSKLIGEVHFNKQKPEHSNIYISNIRDKYVMVYNGDDWKLAKHNDTILELYEECAEKLETKTIKKFQRFLDKEDDDAIINSIKQEIKLLLYNNRKIPIEIRKLLESKELETLECIT
jgi:uncharacterized C2H2 Zn-finger protein